MPAVLARFLQGNRTDDLPAAGDSRMRVRAPGFLAETEQKLCWVGPCVRCGGRWGVAGV